MSHWRSNVDTVPSHARAPDDYRVRHRARGVGAEQSIKADTLPVRSLGVAAPGSSGNYLDAGVRSLLPVARSAAVLAHLNVRHHTGLRSDNSLATAAITSAALTLGLVQDLGNGYGLQPFARAQMGRTKTGNNSASARGLAAGVTLGMRF